MKVLLAAAILCMTGLTAAQPAGSGWPPHTCVHGTTINDSPRPLSLRALEGTIRSMLQKSGLTLSSSECRNYVNVLFHADPVNAQVSRITAHLIFSEREVALDEVKRNAAGFACGRTVTEVLQQHEDFLASAQTVVTRLLATPLRCDL